MPIAVLDRANQAPLKDVRISVRKHRNARPSFQLGFHLFLALFYQSNMASTNDNMQEPKALEDGRAEYTTLHETQETVNGDLATLDAGYNESDVIADLPPAAGKKALRKVDIRLVPLLAVSEKRQALYVCRRLSENELRYCT